LKRIICVGNPLVVEDAAGPRVFLHLAGGDHPADVEVIDGGLAGLDLLGLVESSERVVFVDQVRGLAAPGSVVRLEPAHVAALAGPTPDHDAGLPYLLRVLPWVCDGPLPDLHVVGIEGPVDADLIEQAASLAMQLAGAARAP
jgi:hydrogenase maturation protease